MGFKIFRQVWLAAGILIFMSCQNAGKGTHDYEVVVYGETPGGVTAAIQAAKMNKRVALLSNTGRVGGIITEGLGGTDIDNHGGFQNSAAVGGLALDFYKRIAAAYGRLDELEEAVAQKLKRPELWRFEPSVAEQVIKTWVAEFDIDVFYDARLGESAHAVTKEGGRITEIQMLDGRKFTGQVFIDATIEGDLLARAGVTTVVGREANSVYGEERNGIIPIALSVPIKTDISPYRIVGDSASGLLPSITDDQWGEPGEGDHRLQAYCFRVCMTDVKDNQLPFTKPDDYDRSRYEIYQRYLSAGGRLYVPRSNIPNNKTDFNGGGDLSHNLFGMNYAYPSGDYSTRKEILNYHRSFTQGLFYFLANDPEVGLIAPEFQNEWKRWGLAKDEFVDNDGWPRDFYVRDARRMISDFVVTEHHVKKEGAAPIVDPVAVAYWPPDVHSVRRVVSDGRIYNEGAVFGGDWWKPFGIPFSSLYPRSSECVNLLTPTCPSSSHIAYGAIRLEWTFMALGQACGTAAAMAVEQSGLVQEVDYDELSARLRADGAVISLDF